MLAITLIEVGNSEAPNIGTITSTKDFIYELNEKAKEALESHFDCEVESFIIQDELTLLDVVNSTPLDAVVYLSDDTNHKIEIQQTFLY